MTTFSIHYDVFNERDERVGEALETFHVDINGYRTQVDFAVGPAILESGESYILKPHIENYSQIQKMKRHHG